MPDMLRWLTAGESHGQALVATLEGLPAGVEVTTSDVAGALARRRLGYGRGARMKFEQDQVTFLGGVRHGSTLGSPLAVMIGNTEWPKWETVMSADPVDAAELAHRTGHIDAALLERHRYVLGLLGLPTSYSGASFDELLTALRRDKKTRGATLRFVVLDALAEPTRLVGPDESLLREAYVALA